ncbi:MAG: asparaginase [Candidatus Woesearchaeota archaeon]|jgi:L-asparaginase
MINNKKILLIQTGGTISQEKGPNGAFRPSEKNILEFVPSIYELATIETIKTANIDSTNMETSDRAMLANTIYKNHLKYDGFVITHGTDTMADTAAALNYMLQNLGKPIVLTGSQKSIFVPASDAQNNLYNAITTATMDIGEIVIAFGDKIVRGNRADKINERGLNAFDSPRIPPVGEIGIDILLKSHRIKRSNGDPILFTNFDTDIEFYQQASGTSTRIFEGYVKNNKIHGIVIGGYGAGNVQTRLIPYIKDATKKGKPVIVVTKSQLGAAEMGRYDVGSDALIAGAIPAGDLTTEAATQKLMYALGRANKDKYQGIERLEFIKTLIHRPYAKDMTTIGDSLLIN